MAACALAEMSVVKAILLVPGLRGRSRGVWDEVILKASCNSMCAVLGKYVNLHATMFQGMGKVACCPFSKLYGLG